MSEEQDQSGKPAMDGAAHPEGQVKDAGKSQSPKLSSVEGTDSPAVDAAREAKLKAAAEARAARAAAKAAEAEAAEVPPEEPKPPSPRQKELDGLTELLRQEVAEGAVEDAYLNELNADMPVVVISNQYWREAARLLKGHGQLQFNYLRNVSGVDYETHMEVVYHMISLGSKREVAIKIKTDREAAAVYSAAPVWATANWNEREIFDLLGVDFPGHPDLRRIMMPDDWVGHPLRKDYESLDSEV